MIDLAKDFRVPGAEQEGFFYLRDVVDADVLVAAIAKLKKTDGKVWRPGRGTEFQYVPPRAGRGITKPRRSAVS